MDFSEPQSIKELVADRQVTSRKLIAAWGLVLLAFVALAAVQAPVHLLYGAHKPVGQKEARSATVEHPC